MPNYFGPDGTGAGNDTGPAMDDPREAELARMRTQLAESGTKAAGLEREIEAAIAASGVVKHTDISECAVAKCGCIMLGLPEIVAVLTRKLAASEANRKLLATECQWCRTITNDPETTWMAKAWMMSRLGRARAATDAACALEGE